MTKTCWVCGGSCEKRVVVLRGNARRALLNCPKCHFCFFNFDNSRNLKKNQLDHTRLFKAGLEIPSVKEDFENGIRQARSYVHQYVRPGDRSKNILDIGCSWGYFLKEAKKKGVRPFGIEINPLRARYVNSKLAIPCYQSLEEVEKAGIHFRKIFLFYILEYLGDPQKYLKRLCSLLEVGGEIIVITPNLEDVLKDIWRNPGFERFFFDETAIAYYSFRAMKKLLASVDDAADLKVTTEQGYGFINHLGWFLTQKPRTTGIVGGDRYAQDLADRLSHGQGELGKDMADLIRRFDLHYRRLIEKRDRGNRIIAVLKKTS